MTSFNEAPASATVKVLTPEGFEWMFTMRDERPASLIDKIKRFEAAAQQAGWQPAAGSRQPQVQPQPKPQPKEGGKFVIENLIYSGKTKDGKSDVWKAKSAKEDGFWDHGVAMYPEAWGDSGYATPKTGKTINAKGWTCFHNGRKVLRIECPQLETTSTIRQEVEANPHKFAAWPEPPAASHYTDDEFPF